MRVGGGGWRTGVCALTPIFSFVSYKMFPKLQTKGRPRPLSALMTRNEFAEVESEGIS